MDTLVVPERRLRILLETRPGLDKHAGIPQQMRLLFRGLSLIPEFSIEGLLQSSTHALGKGLPRVNERWCGKLPRHKQIDRLARIVIMLEQKYLRSYASVPLLALRSLCGASENLTGFDAHEFRDFIWRRLFAPSLPSVDFDVVTRGRFRVAQASWTAMHTFAMISRSVGRAVFARLNTADFDVMISETPYPATVSKRTRLIVRYHDAIPLLMPHTISERRHHQAFHYRALRRNVESGAWFVCVSEATRKDLLSIFPQAEARSITIYNMVSHDYFDEPSCRRRVREIIRTRLNARIARAHIDRTLKARLFDETSETGAGDYLLMVSTIEPRKNHLTLLSAWERLRSGQFPGLNLIIVGSLGWHHQPIVRKFMPWLERGELFMLEDVPSPELRLLYKHARATICPSLAEGFDLSGVESMRSGGAVVASDIPVHREIYGDGAEYCNPYSVEDLESAIRRVITPERSMRREELATAGAQISSRYAPEAILPAWHAFLTKPVLAEK